jgi:hypothetical protein
MSLKDMLSLTALKDIFAAGGIGFVIIASLLQISKININPWDWLFGLIGDKLNSNLNKQLKEVKGEVKEIKDHLTEHIKESEIKDLQDIRRDILEFANSCMNGRKHTKEQFDFIIKECDNYESYIEKNKIKNGVVTSAIREIRRLNDKCIQENSFLKEYEAS